MTERDRSWRPQFYGGIAAGLVGLICLAVGVGNDLAVVTGIAGFALLAALVLLGAALWGHLARNRA